jgi:carboxynorspermidine decarboxylase
MERLAALCDYVSLNSLPQLQRFRDVLRLVHCGLRVNPGLSFVDDERYDPCRRTSKLGVPIRDLAAAAQHEPESLRGLSGLHVHNNCDSESSQPLVKTVKRLVSRLTPLLRRLDWVNLGGGYLLATAEQLPALSEAIDLLRSKALVEVFIEPGAALVRNAGYLVSTVVDLFENDNAQIAVLDTTVNHMPEVYEYGFEPDVVGHTDDGDYTYVLAGSSCLAGDVFGEYAFDKPLEIGSRIVFPNVGAYTQVKAHMFNGINLPALYRLSEAGELVLRKRFGYEDFKARIGE